MSLAWAAALSCRSLAAFLVLLLLQFGLRHHDDILRAKPVRTSRRNPFHRHLGAGEGHAGVAFEVAALGGRERGPRFVALAVVDDAELIPGERILIVARHGDLQDLLSLGEILR